MNKFTAHKLSAAVEVIECIDHGENFPDWKYNNESLFGEIVDIDKNDITNPIMVYIEGDGISMFRCAGLKPLTKLSAQLIAVAKEIENE